jgi:hypothetical protein
VFQDLEFSEAEALEFELVEAAHVRYMGDGDMFKMGDVGDEKANSWNAMLLIYMCLIFNAIQICSFPWQSKGHRFDSDILHSDYQGFTTT